MAVWGNGREGDLSAELPTLNEERGTANLESLTHYALRNRIGPRNDGE